MPFRLGALATLTAVDSLQNCGEEWVDASRLIQMDGLFGTIEWSNGIAKGRRVGPCLGDVIFAQLLDDVAEMVLSGPSDEDTSQC